MDTSQTIAMSGLLAYRLIPCKSPRLQLLIVRSWSGNRKPNIHLIVLTREAGSCWLFAVVARLQLVRYTETTVHVLLVILSASIEHLKLSANFCIVFRYHLQCNKS